MLYRIIKKSKYLPGKSGNTTVVRHSYSDVNAEDNVYVRLKPSQAKVDQWTFSSIQS